MSGFGGAVKLTGESEYKRALSQITQSLKVVSAEMKATSSSYDSGDKSLKQLVNASKELRSSLEQQKSALSSLKSKLSDMTSEYSKTEQKHKALIAEYEKEKQELDILGKTLGTSSAEYKNQQKVVMDLAQAVDKSTKEYDAQGKAVNNMRIQTANAETTCNETADALDNLGRKAQESSDGFTVMKGVLADLASKAIQKAIEGLKKLGDAIVDAGKQSYSLYAENEQLIGGVETLFGESADKLIDYANKAYKTAGLSANDYMEQATSFSATLLQGLEGDTAKAVEYADLAIRDMSDNANKMGTDMTMIQNAYQGFAKDNYTMLDNLKLGYGGTQAEMARLINDSGVLGDAIEVNKETVKDVPFDKIIEAIHKTQQEIGITGTTALEAEGTIEGSTKSMKAAWENLLVGIASGDADISGLVGSLTDQVIAMGKNMLPRIKQIIKGMGELVTEVWNEVIPELAKEFPQLQPIVDAMNWIKDNSKYIIAGLSGILAGFVAFKTVAFISTIISTVQTLFAAVQMGIPIMQALNVVLNLNPIGLIVAGIATLVTAFTVLWNTSDDFRNFWIGLWENIKEVFSIAWDAIIGFFTETLPNALNNVKEKILEWKDNVVAFFQAIPDKVSEIVQKIITFFKELPYNLGYIVGEAIGHLIKFGSDAWNWVSTKVPEIIEGIVNFFKELPSKIWTWLTETFTKLKTWGSNTIEKAKETGKNFVDNVILFFKELPSKVWTWLTDTISKVGTFAVDIASKAKEGAKNMFDNVVNGIKELPEKVKNIGKNIVEGLWEGIKGAGSWIKDKIKGFADGLLDGMKNALGIKSPSKLFRDEVGKYMAQGVGVGFEQEMKDVSAQMQDSIPTSFDTGMTVGSSNSAAVGGFAFETMISAFKEALYQVKIEMDDEEMGRFIDKTVTRLVYS